MAMVTNYFHAEHLAYSEHYIYCQVDKSWSRQMSKLYSTF
jgi:hypothetical protein